MKAPLLIIMGVVVLVAGMRRGDHEQRLQEQPSRMVRAAYLRPFLPSCRLRRS